MGSANRSERTSCGSLPPTRQHARKELFYRTQYCRGTSETMIEGGTPSALAQRCNMCWQVRPILVRGFTRNTAVYSIFLFVFLYGYLRHRCRDSVCTTPVPPIRDLFMTPDDVRGTHPE